MLITTCSRFPKYQGRCPRRQWEKFGCGCLSHRLQRPSSTLTLISLPPSRPIVSAIKPVNTKPCSTLFVACTAIAMSSLSSTSGVKRLCAVSGVSLPTTTAGVESSTGLSWVRVPIENRCSRLLIVLQVLIRELSHSRLSRIRLQTTQP